MIEYVQGIHPAEIWVDSRDDAINHFARKGTYDYVGYYWPENEPIEDLVKHLKSGCGMEMEYGYEYQEIDLVAGVYRKVAFMDIGMQHSSDEEIYAEIRRRVAGVRIEKSDDQPLTLPQKVGNKYIWITENEKKFYSRIIENQEIEKIKSFCTELGYEKLAKKCKSLQDFIPILGYIRDDSTLFVDYGEYYLYLKYYFLGEGNPSILGDGVSTLVGNGVVIADYSVKDKNGIPVCYSAISELEKMKDITVVKEKLQEGIDAVYYLSTSDMSYARFEQIVSACAKVKLYAIAKNKYTGETILFIKKAKTKIKEGIFIETMDPGILRCVPNVGSDEWNSIIEKKGKKPALLPISLFCNFSVEQNETKSEETEEQAGEKIQAKHSGKGYKVKVKFGDGKAYYYNCYEEIKLGDTAFVGGKREGDPGKIVEIAGPAAKGPYMQDVEYLIVGGTQIDEMKPTINIHKTIFEEDLSCKKYSDVEHPVILDDDEIADLYICEEYKVSYGLFDIEPGCMKGIVVCTHNCSDDAFFIIDYIGAEYKQYLTEGTKYLIVEKRDREDGSSKMREVQALIDKGSETIIVSVDELVEIARNTTPGSLDVSLDLSENYDVEGACSNERYLNYVGLKVGDEISFKMESGYYGPEVELIGPKGSLGTIYPDDFDTIMSYEDEWDFRARVRGYNVIKPKESEAESAVISVEVFAVKKGDSTATGRIIGCNTKFRVVCIDPDYAVKLARCISDEVNDITFNDQVFVCTECDTEEKIAKFLEKHRCKLASSTVLKTNYIIIGNEIDHKTTKISRALELIGKGIDIKAITEDEFWKLAKGK